MASGTYDTAIASFRRRFPDATPAVAIAHMATVMRDLLGVLPEFARSTATIDMVNGTREYALGETVAQVATAYYEASASSKTQLIETSIEALERTKRGWRAVAADVNSPPEMFYLGASATGGKMIGFHPIPPVTKGGSYPIVTVYTTIVPAIAGTTSLPQALQSGQVFVEGASYYAAMDLRPSDVEGFHARYMAALANEVRHYRTLVEGLKEGPVVNIRG